MSCSAEAKSDRFRGAELVDQVSYRGVTLNVYRDPIDLGFWTIVAGKPAKVCGPEGSFRAEIERLIDESAFCVADFGGGAKLVRFLNGGHEDFKLVDRGRILKVYVTNGAREPDLGRLAESAAESLRSYREAIAQRD